jgi:Uma2 family endonuclease
MSSAVQQIPRRYRLTVKEYHGIADAGIFPVDARTELIDGEIIEMPPIGAAHAGITKHLIDLFTRVVQGKAIVDAQDPVVIGIHSELQPDLALLRWREDFYVKSHPQPRDVLLLVEIADTTLEYDRDTKIPLYAKAGISEVWLIDVKGKHLDIYRQPEDGRYASQRRALELGHLQVEALPSLDFDLSTLFDCL